MRSIFKLRNLLTVSAAVLLLIAFKADRNPTIYLIGDSTVRNFGENQRGWGTFLGEFLDTTKISINNQAMAGRSTRTFIKEKRWAKVDSMLKPGDFVMMQFGHNEGSVPDTGKAGYRGVLRGTGEETKELTWKDGTKEIVHTYGWYIRSFIRATKAKGATPIVLSMIPRNQWKDGKVLRADNDFGKWAREVAEQERVTFINLNGITADKYDKWGQEKVKAFFIKDHTHPTAEGARINAESVADGIRAQKKNPLKKYLKKINYTNSIHMNRIFKWSLIVAVVLFSSFILTKPADKPALFLIGDSTVKNGKGKGDGGLWGWGSFIHNYFDTTRITVKNEALGGTSTRTFMYRGRWEAVLPQIKKGDYLMMQFGHNDSSPLDDTARARGTIKSNGDEVKDIYNPITKQQETVHSYGWYLRKFVADAKAKGATVIICSPIPRNQWNEGKVRRSTGDYGKWAKEAAVQSGAYFIDLNTLIAEVYDKEGEAKVKSTYFNATDHTHPIEAGAKLNAARVVEGIKGINGLSLNHYLTKQSRK